MRHTISAVIITKNEQKDISRCLESVKWADEIVVVDDYSEDDTVKICNKYTHNIFLNKFHSFASQKKFAFSKATKNWILSLDADEEVPEELREEILKTLSSGRTSVDGYFMPRKTFFSGKWIAHCGWYPEYQLRLFKVDSWDMKDVYVHESVKVSGAAGYFKNPIYHYSFSSIFEYIERFNSYTSLAAVQMLRDGVKLDTYKIKAIAVGKAAKTFWKMYVKQSGFRDGMRGLFLCFFSAAYQLMVYAKFWELSSKGISQEV